MTHRKLPQERTGIDKRCQVDGRKFVIITGEYPDGTLGEVNIRVGKTGDEFRLLTVALMCVSIGLQRGVPLSAYIENLKWQEVGEGGVTDDDDSPLVKNILSYIVDFLDRHYGEKETKDEDSNDDGVDGDDDDGGE